jgi:polysaccharide export outer membrane protein
MKITNSYFSFATVVTAACLMALLVSCSSAKKLQYFRNLPDSATVELPPTYQEDRVVEAGDRLNIAIGGRDQEAAAFFNKHAVSSGAPTSATGASASSGSGGGDESGYLVNNEGFIEMPMLGVVHVRGLTQNALKADLTKRVTPFLKEPLVDVAFTTFTVTLIGEVRGPGAHTLSMQRTTIFDALAAGGDLPHSAKRYDISLYRDYKGKRTITKVDLRKKDFLYNDQVFQMRHNDIIYVQPRNASIFTEDFGLFSSLFTILVTTVTLAITLSK